MELSYSKQVHVPARGLLKRFLDSEDSVCIVSGPAGVGKTVLVDSVLLETGVDKVRIKLDQFGLSESLPFQILQKFGKSLLASKDDSIYGYQESISICNETLIKLEKILNQTFILFIDDVQWIADQDLQSLNRIISNYKYCFIKVIFVFRDEEKFTHRKIQLLTKLAYCQIDTFHIDLNPLSEEESLHLLNRDLTTHFNDNPEKQKALIGASKGIPFFLELFKSIGYDNDSENLDRFLVVRLGHESCYIAFVCAQIGFDFDKSIIEAYFNDAMNTVNASLESLVNNKILIKKSVSEKERVYGFTHDYIYNIFRNFYSIDKLEEVNGKLFTSLSGLPSERLDNTLRIKKAIFLMGASEHFKSFLSKDEIYHVFTLGLESACRILSVSMGFSLAQYIDTEIVKKRFSKSQAIRLGELISIIANYNDDLPFAKKVIGHIESFDLTPNEQSKLIALLARLYFSRGMMNDSINHYRQALGETKLQEVMRQRKFSIVNVIISLLRVNRYFQSKQSISNLNTSCTNETIRTRNKIMSEAISSAYSVDAHFSATLVAKMLINSFKYGCTDDTGYALQLYASAICCGYLRDYKKGLYLSELAFMEMSLQHSQYYFYRSLFLYHSFLGVHINSIGHNVDSLHDVFYKNLNEFSVDISAYAAHVASFHRLDSNVSLHDNKYWIDVYVRSISAYHQNNARQWIAVLEQFIDDLMCEQAKESFIDGSYFSINSIAKTDDRSLIFIAHHYKGVINVLFHRWDEALEDFKVSARYKDGVVGTYGEFLHEFYKGVAVAREAITKQRMFKPLKKLYKCRRFLALPKEIGSKVVLSKEKLISGYIFFLENDFKQAKICFQKARDFAKENGHLLDQILALDALHMAENSNTFYLQEIGSITSRWGSNILTTHFLNRSTPNI